MSDTTLIHSGPGDNVAGSKILNIGTYIETITSTTPDSLKTPVRAILDAINNRNFDAAREKISLIESMGGLENAVTELLTILKIKCEHTSNPSFEIDLREITATLRNSENKIVKDLALSLILSVESTTKEIEKAKKRFEQSKDVGPYSKAVALAFFSTKEELIQLYRDDMDNLSEVELNGIIEGLTRLKCFVEAQQVADYLKLNFDNYNSQYAAVFTKALVFNESIQKRDYWILTQLEKDEVDNLLNEALQIYKDSECSDSRLFSIFFPSLIFTKFSNDELIEVCASNIDKAEIFAKDYADEIRMSLKAGDVSDNHQTKILEKIICSDKDKEEKISEIIKTNEVDNLTFWIAEEIIPDDDFRAWIDNGVTITGTFSDFENKLNALRVLLLSSNDAELDTCIESLLKTPKPEHEHINSEFIQALSELLYKRERENEACDLLLYFLKEIKDIWCSPLICYTLFKLHSIARHKDVISLIDKVNDKEKPIEIHNMIVWTHLYYGSAKEALTEAKKIKENNSLHGIDLKFKTLYKLGMFAQIDEIISNLDGSLFAKPKSVTLEIIKILIERNNFKLVESIIIDWFKESLENNYYYISEACLQIIMSKNVQNFKPSYNINGLERAIQYFDGDKSIIKIISSDDNLSNRHTLTPSSILAKAFKDKEVGDEVISGIKHLKIENFLPPFVAIKNLATEIRDESNDGSDVFQILTLSENPETMVEQFSRYLPQNKIDDTLFTNKAIPLAIRMNLINKNDPVKSAMMLLQNQDTKFEALINGGKNIETDACTDIITIMYLCLTSTSQYFVKNGIKLHLTQDDIDALKNWVNYVENVKSLSVSKDENGKILCVPSELVKKFNANVIANLKNIFPLLHVLTIIPDNYDKTFNDNIKTWGHRCVKSIYAIKNSDIPIFSIDTQLCWFMVHLFKITPINPYKLIGDAASTLSISQRENLIILHAVNGLPFPIQSTDFLNLACSPIDPEGDVLCKLLSNYVGSFNDELRASDFLAQVFDCYLRKSVITNSLPGECYNNSHLTAFNNPYGPKVDRVFNICCRAVMKHKYASSEISAEEKLAKFFVSLVPSMFSKPNTKRFITTLFFLYMQGHFLDMGETNKKAMEIITS